MKSKWKKDFQNTIDKNIWNFTNNVKSMYVRNGNESVYIFQNDKRSGEMEKNIFNIKLKLIKICCCFFMSFR